jgi:dihydrofolate synthase/folylpolyglutamate synthase
LNPVERLLGLEQFGIKLGLDNIRVLLETLGHPETAWPSIHIAGTNGKGSVSAMIERALRATGLRTGRYTSPHLAAIEERVAIDGVPVDAGRFSQVTADVLSAVDRAIRLGTLPVTPTFFEVSTAVAFEIFRRERIHVAVVEVGLGGRFDATNTISPTVTAVTSIDFDHERHLGRTLRAIAFEKAGIAKPGVPLVLGRMAPDAADVITEVAGRAAAPVVIAHDGVTAETAMTRGRARLSLTTPLATYPSATLSLAGRHQVDNAIVAARVLEVWGGRGTPITGQAIATGFSDCEWPGRLEWLVLPDGGEVLLDAAHNPSGAAALAAYLSDAGVAPLPIVFAAMRDKDVKGMLAPLAPLASRFIATTVTSSRALDVESIAAEMLHVAPETDLESQPSPDLAVDQALHHATRAVVAGSIYLIGPLRARLLATGARRVQS